MSLDSIPGRASNLGNYRTGFARPSLQRTKMAAGKRPHFPSRDSPVDEPNGRGYAGIFGPRGHTEPQPERRSLRGSILTGEPARSRCAVRENHGRFRPRQQTPTGSRRFHDLPPYPDPGFRVTKPGPCCPDRAPPIGKARSEDRSDGEGNRVAYPCGLGPYGGAAAPLAPRGGCARSGRRSGSRLPFPV